MTNLILCLVLQVNTFPQNAGSDRYTMIAPMGKVSSIACSNFQVFALSDEYVFIIDKSRFKMENTIYLGRAADLVAYDQYTSDLWVVYHGEIMRLSTLIGAATCTSLAPLCSTIFLMFRSVIPAPGIMMTRSPAFCTKSAISSSPSNTEYS